jgi:hypothetical protein
MQYINSLGFSKIIFSNISMALSTQKQKEEGFK